MDVNPLLFSVLKGLLLIAVILTLCSYVVLAERKVASWIQGRVGPNRTTLPLLGAIPIIGPFLTRLGFFQPMADGLKFLFKEDIVPGHVNRFYYFLAPVLSFIPAFLIVAVVPFGHYIDDAGVAHPLVLANLDIGMLFVLAVSSLGVYGLILAGWASNSKYPFLGGIRSSAQMISYELAMGLSILPVFMWANAPVATPDGQAAALNLFAVVGAQETLWIGIWQPLSALIFLVALFAETNRLPFDMPESETELVGGFHTEYSSFKFGLFFVAEYAHMIVGSAVLVILFFGGWHFLPGIPLGIGGIFGALFSILIFMAKVAAVLFFFIWVRWTVPRFRYDQVMNLGWKILLPLAIGNLIFNALLIAGYDTLF
ncbi:MAG: complex I subunit 1 family protein [Opitutales bacterium]